MKNLFFVYCNESGFELFETLDDALDAANERVQGYLEDAWSDEVTSVCAGKITHRAKMCDQVFPDGEIDEDGFDEAGDYWDPDCDYKCNYKMLPAERNPAPEVVKLVEALQSLLDMQDQDCRYDHQGYCQNHNLDHIDVGCRVQKARTALAAYRKQKSEEELTVDRQERMHKLRSGSDTAVWAAEEIDRLMEDLARCRHQSSYSIGCKDALNRYESIRDNVGGCGDHGCLIKKPSGMATNGGCRCTRDYLKTQRMMMAAQNLFSDISELYSGPAHEVEPAYLRAQPAPEISHIVKLLDRVRSSVDYQMSAQNQNHEAGRKHYAHFQALLGEIDAALATHRKQGGES